MGLAWSLSPAATGVVPYEDDSARPWLRDHSAINRSSWTLLVFHVPKGSDASAAVDDNPGLRAADIGCKLHRLGAVVVLKTCRYQLHLFQSKIKNELLEIKKSGFE